MNRIVHVKKDLRSFANSRKAEVLKSFFKTGKGHYGEGDIFLGVTVPQTREVARAYADLPLRQIRALLSSKVHEERYCALMILARQFYAGDRKTQKIIFDFYMQHIRQVNSWDLVDASAASIAGRYLLERPRKILYMLARSENLWERRIAIVATYAFIQNGEYADTVKIAKMLMPDTHDLIHKAVGWMLREVGKRSPQTEKDFLKKFRTKMPRTMLRYAIERFPEKERKSYLK